MSSIKNRIFQLFLLHEIRICAFDTQILILVLNNKYYIAFQAAARALLLSPLYTYKYNLWECVADLSGVWSVIFFSHIFRLGHLETNKTIFLGPASH